MERLRALEQYQVMDALPEDEFNDIVELAAAICNTPISLISLLDHEKQWFLAKTGIELDETRREYAFCHYAIQRPEEVMIVEDALTDSRFRNNPLVTNEPQIRFYAGAPLLTWGNTAIGTLCVIDKEPRQFSEEESRMLKVLAGKVVRTLELRRENLTQRRQLNATNEELEVVFARLLEAQHVAQIGSWDWNLRTGRFYWSDEMYGLFGLNKQKQPATIRQWQALVHPEDVSAVRSSLVDGLKNGTPGVVEYRVNRPDGKQIWLQGRGAATTTKEGDVVRIYGTVQDITARKEAEQSRRQYRKTLEEMLFSLSHKIRRPATSCLGLVQVLERDTLSEEKIRSYASLFKESIEELDHYIHEATDFIVENQTKLDGRSNRKDS